MLLLAFVAILLCYLYEGFISYILKSSQATENGALGASVDYHGMLLRASAIP